MLLLVYVCVCVDHVVHVHVDQRHVRAHISQQNNVKKKRKYLEDNSNQAGDKSLLLFNIREEVDGKSSSPSI